MPLRVTKRLWKFISGKFSKAKAKLLRRGHQQPQESEVEFQIISSPQELDNAQIRERKNENRQTQVSDGFLVSPKKAPYEDHTDQFSGLQDIHTPTSSAF